MRQLLSDQRNLLFYSTREREAMFATLSHEEIFFKWLKELVEWEKDLEFARRELASCAANSHTEPEFNLMDLFRVFFDRSEGGSVSSQDLDFAFKEIGLTNISADNIALLIHCYENSLKVE